MISRRIGTVLFAFATTAAAQIPFQLLVSQSNNAITVQNGASLTFVTAVGQSETAQLRATYTGTGQVLFPRRRVFLALPHSRRRWQTSFL